jgi:putative DNA-invertase from lambdoid prophage Rac
MVFTVLGAVAELERSLIVERVKAGLRNARAKGKRIGRPASDVDASQIAQFRFSNVSWREIGKKLGVSARTARRAFSERGKTLSANTSASAVD